MAHRAHLLSLKIAHALRDSMADSYNQRHFKKDVIAGLTVGIIAIPLAMALAIASGTEPQYGLYTAIIAGVIAAFFGGSRYSITGPTAAFVVLLHPLATQYGLSGLLLTTAMSGVMLVLMAYARLGRYIEYIPEPVVFGFTGGIAVVIATFQVPDLLGLEILTSSSHYLEKLSLIAAELPHYDQSSMMIALLTLAIMLLWPRLKTPIPAHLPAMMIASIAALVLNNSGFMIDTIGSRFHYLATDGTLTKGIPPYLPTLEWPWQRLDNSGNALALSWQMVGDLLPIAFAIAMLGAIESLLCAVVLDGMSGKRHSANSELFGQGLANIITPFFGGITATAAIARSATNFKVGAQSPIASIVHSSVVLLGLVALTSILAYLPMPAMAALLLVVAWNMSEAPKIKRMIARSPSNDVIVFLVCFLLTIFFDMVIAITAGIVLASILFMKALAELTELVEVSSDDKRQKYNEANRRYEIRGAMYFAAADRVCSELALKIEGVSAVTLDMTYMPYLDTGGISAIEKLIDFCAQRQIKIQWLNWQKQPQHALARAKLTVNFLQDSN